jgi:hypothetical protein
MPIAWKGGMAGSARLAVSLSSSQIVIMDAQGQVRAKLGGRLSGWWPRR